MARLGKLCLHLAFLKVVLFWGSGTVRFLVEHGAEHGSPEKKKTG
jgi:hypothetical protein